MNSFFSKKTLILMVGDLCLAVASYYLSYALRTGEYVDVASKHTGATLLSLPILFFILYTADVYSNERGFQSIGFIGRLAAAIVVAWCLISATFYFLRPWLYGRVVLVMSGFLVFFLLILWRLFFYHLVEWRNIPSKILFLGVGEAGKTIIDLLAGNRDYEVIGFLDEEGSRLGEDVGASKVIGEASRLQEFVEKCGIEKVVVTLNQNAPPELLNQLMQVKFSGVGVYNAPAFYESVTGKIPVFHINDGWLDNADFYGSGRNLYNSRIKNLIDKIVSVFLILITLPLTLAAFVAIRFGSKGPVFFKQERVGGNEKIFKIAKFRTMRVGMERERSDAGKKNDPRITKVGRILRFFRIDELPQLFNVLKGEMSLVGPRSLMREEVEEFSKRIPYFRLRHSVKPGITGWAQVNYKHGIHVNDAVEKLEYDLFYIKNLSPPLDFYILLKTIKVVLFGRGAR